MGTLINLGDISAVWTPAAFLIAGIAGLVFGFLVGHYYRAVYADLRNVRVVEMGLLLAWWVAIMVGSQAMASLIEGDPLWTRALSRAGPYLFGVLCTSLGIFLGRGRRK